jgi:hypothetical protein
MEENKIETIIEDFDWIRKKEYFTKDDINRLLIMCEKYLNRTIKCSTCSGGLNQAKWDLVSFLSTLKDNYVNQPYTPNFNCTHKINSKQILDKPRLVQYVKEKDLAEFKKELGERIISPITGEELFEDYDRIVVVTNEKKRCKICNRVLNIHNKGIICTKCKQNENKK